MVSLPTINHIEPDFYEDYKEDQEETEACFYQYMREGLSKQNNNAHKFHGN